MWRGIYTGMSMGTVFDDINVGTGMGSNGCVAIFPGVPIFIGMGTDRDT